MKNLFSVLLITTLAIASTLATPETPQGEVQAPITSEEVQAPITSEESALWDKKKYKETGGPCNFACDRVAVEGCVKNAGPGSFAACSKVFSCQHRCENIFGLQDPCGEVCASSDCLQRCIRLRKDGSLISSDIDACKDVCGGCDHKCIETFPSAIVKDSIANCESGCKARDDCRKYCEKTE